MSDVFIVVRVRDKAVFSRKSLSAASQLANALTMYQERGPEGWRKDPKRRIRVYRVTAGFDPETGSVVLVSSEVPPTLKAASEHKP